MRLDSRCRRAAFAVLCSVLVAGCTLATLRQSWGGQLGERIRSRLQGAAQRLREA